MTNKNDTYVTAHNVAFNFGNISAGSNIMTNETDINYSDGISMSCERFEWVFKKGY